LPLLSITHFLFPFLSLRGKQCPASTTLIFIASGVLLDASHAQCIEHIQLLIVFIVLSRSQFSPRLESGRPMISVRSQLEDNKECGAPLLYESQWSCLVHIKDWWEQIYTTLSKLVY
jgi:hypothetical protein